MVEIPKRMILLDLARSLIEPALFIFLFTYAFSDAFIRELPFDYDPTLDEASLPLAVTTLFVAFKIVMTIGMLVAERALLCGRRT